MSLSSFISTAFAAIDARPDNCMLIFADRRMADQYAFHRAFTRRVVGILVRVEDTRTHSGLLVQWRDPIPAQDFPRRQSEARWMLEEALAGRVPRPTPQQVTDVTADTEASRRAQIVGLS